ncbi:MAG: hypothetical protein RR194_02205, partial [Ruthenibacterium sp.]
AAERVGLVYNVLPIHAQAIAQSSFPRHGCFLRVVKRLSLLAGRFYVPVIGDAQQQCESTWL